MTHIGQHAFGANQEPHLGVVMLLFVIIIKRLALFVFFNFQIKKAIPPLSLHGQVLWREFFYCAATKNPNFDRMKGNPICVQVPWDKNPEALAKWANVSTKLH